MSLQIRPELLTSVTLHHHRQLTMFLALLAYPGCLLSGTLVLISVGHPEFASITPAVAGQTIAEELFCYLLH